MISALVSSYWVDDEKPEILKRCLNSLEGADEILSLVTHSKAPSNFTDSWNRLATLAKGEYLIFIGDNNTLTNGDLKHLCIPNTVTSPLIDGKAQDFWGMVFCMPRNIYEKIGLYDPVYARGCHYEDEDLYKRLQQAGIPCFSVSSVNFTRGGGGRTIHSMHNYEGKSAVNKMIYERKWND
jgi:GT2 family glycosyltransferase